MAHNTHEDVARRWVNRILSPGRQALPSRNLLDRGDQIFSYGSHFEVGRILRDRKGQPKSWLLNGDRWPGVVTTRHQNEVRSAVAGHGLPVVTIPHQALDSAGIDLATVDIVDVQSDWWTKTVITKEHLVGTWDYELDYSDYGGWQNSLTGEFVARGSYWGPNAVREPGIECDHEIDMPGPWKMGFNWEREKVLREKRDVHDRLHHGVWETVSPHRRNTGRKRAMMTTHTEWELVDEPDAPLGYIFKRVVRRHWLGGSLIKAQVPYQIQTKHQECNGTGVSPAKWYVRNTWRDGQGPLTEEQMADAQRRNDILMSRDSGIRPPLGWAGFIEVYDEHTECRGCGGRGRVSATRRRTAYFLSGFDENETRPSYYFCELPPKVKPQTVEEALETLKPEAVRIAEQMGREVKRQGDIFATPMPGLTLRELKQQGGQHVRKPKLVQEDPEDPGSRLVASGPRPNLLGTNHEATEVVYVGRQTYARGVIRHVPESRRPDHRALSLGKQWHLIQKNTVPVSA